LLRRRPFAPASKDCAQRKDFVDILGMISSSKRRCPGSFQAGRSGGAGLSMRMICRRSGEPQANVIARFRAGFSPALAHRKSVIEKSGAGRAR